MDISSRKVRSYLPDLKDYSVSFAPEWERAGLPALLPQGICPFLLHSCLPYIFTFESGGSFPWMELEKDRFSVRVQCPNSRGGVECLVYKREDGVFVRITAVRGECLFGHKRGDTVNAGTSGGMKIPLPVYDACFAWMVYFHSLREGSGYSSPRMALEDGDIKMMFCLHKEAPGAPEETPFKRSCPDPAAVKNARVRLSSCLYRCRYFKWPRRDNFDGDKLYPAGLCPELFHLGHLYAMRGIYSERGRETQRFCCPDPVCGVKAAVTVRRTRTYFLRRLFSSLLRLFGNRTEVPLYICEFLIADSSPDCPMRLKKGDRFVYNMGRKYELCPAAFDNIHFTLHNLARAGEIFWKECSCPDPESRVCFEIDNVPPENT